MKFRCFPRSDSLRKALARVCSRSCSGADKTTSNVPAWKHTPGPERKLAEAVSPFFVYEEGRCRARKHHFPRFPTSRASAPLSSGKVLPFTPGDKTVPAGSRSSLFDLAIKTRNTACLVNERAKERQERGASQLLGVVRASRVNTSSPAVPRFRETKSGNTQQAILQLNYHHPNFSECNPAASAISRRLWLLFSTTCNVAIRRIYSDTRTDRFRVWRIA